MSRFEFVMMIASVVVAIGMTEIAGGWGKIVRTPARVCFDWLHLGWTIYLLLLAIQYWVGMWSYNQLEITYVGQIYFLVIPTVFLVIAAYAITPDVPLDGVFDVRDYYLANRIGVFLPLAMFSVAAWIADLAIAGLERLEIGFMIMSLLVAAGMVILAMTKKIWVHASILGISILIVIGGLFTEMSYHDSRWLTP
jgi:hypothetical protein